MEYSTSSTVLTIFISYVVYLVVGGLIHSQRLRIRAKKLNCEPPPILKNSLPLGIDQVTRSLKALATKDFPPDTQKKHKEVNALTYRNSVLGKDGFATIDEQNIRAMLGTQFPEFDLGAPRIDNFQPFLGPGIFAQDGKDWERSRALIRPQFARDNLSDLEMEERHFHILLKALPETGQDGWLDEVDIQPLLFRFTLDTATEFLLGQSVDSQLAGIKTASGVKTEETDVEAFGREFEIGTMGLGKRSKFAPFSWLIWPKGFRKAISTCHGVIDRIVAEHLQKLETSGETKNPDRYVFFEALAEKTEIRLNYAHRRADIWGEDVDEFKPERWEGRKGGWDFLPFNGGPRICLGQQYALTEASFFIIRLLQKFDQIESADKEEITFNLTLTMCSGNGVKIKLHAAEA
ncbi:hypothetical protein EYC84_004867 [Monilinia fructicola]|uniref:Cytochrome P450 n=1 Tax=Monilinia fructicola TaxID=38448 RepID=A0A5M9K563_MONFR|nr:hypothetical protein EYC84_004867 [Monilinia fructicola]